MADDKVLVKDSGPLYELKELVEEKLDSVESQQRDLNERSDKVVVEVEQHRAALEESRQLLESVNERLDKMDKALPKGDKDYIPALSGEQQSKKARQGLGEMMIDLCRDARGLSEKHGFITHARDQEEATDGDGGFLVPEEQANEIIRLVSNFGFARQNCRILPMNRAKIRLPVSTYGPTTMVEEFMSFTQGAGNEQQGEGSLGFEASTAFTRPELVAARLLAFDEISIEVAEDSTPSLMNFLVDIFAEAVALAEDRQVLTASVQPFTGILKLDAPGEKVLLASQSHSFANVTYEDLVDVYDAVDEKVQDQGIWVMSSFAWNQFRKIVDGNSRPLFYGVNEGVLGASPAPTLLGRPVKFSTVMPKALGQTADNQLLCYGDFSRYAVFGDRRGMTVDISPHAKFTYGQLVMRVMERFAFKAVVEGAFSRLTASS